MPPPTGLQRTPGPERSDGRREQALDLALRMASRPATHEVGGVRGGSFPRLAAVWRGKAGMGACLRIWENPPTLPPARDPGTPPHGIDEPPLPQGPSFQVPLPQASRQEQTRGARSRNYPDSLAQRAEVASLLARRPDRPHRALLPRRSGRPPARPQRRHARSARRPRRYHPNRNRRRAHARRGPRRLEPGKGDPERGHAETLRGHAETLRDHAETLRGHAETLRQRFRGTGNFVAAPASEASSPASAHG